ncbi:MAG: HipA domain-containing protein [Clostridia bacterium]
MIDFTKCKEEINQYKGSEKKKTLIYNNVKYLVKFPDPLRQKNKDLSYINNAFSEYIGSKIFELIGIKTQKTLLGYYNINGKEKIVCACEDFTTENKTLYEFENLANSTLLDKKVETEITDIMKIISDNKNLINETDTIKKFWEMFVVDSLIGNTDRHNGNWGFLKDNETDQITFAPIYDCGSCLNPLLDDEEIKSINDTELKNLALNCYSCLKENGKKINYAQFILSTTNAECNEAIVNIFPKINMEEIKEMINNIPCISDCRKNFYINILAQRYEQILYPKYQKLNLGL